MNQEIPKLDVETLKYVVEKVKDKKELYLFRFDRYKDNDVTMADMMLLMVEGMRRVISDLEKLIEAQQENSKEEEVE